MTVQEQRMSALEKANRIRTENARRVVEIAALQMEDGLELVARMLEEPDEYTLAIPVDRLIKGVHRIGEDKAVRILKQADVNTRRQVKRLTERQRLVIAKALRGHGNRSCEDCGAPVSRWDARRCFSCYRESVAA